MEHTNTLVEMGKQGGVDKETLLTFVRLLAPFAPHVSEELFAELGQEGSVFHSGWPAYDEKLMEADVIEIAVQVCGKKKAVISLPKDVSKEDAIQKAKEALGDKLTGNIVKEIYVPGRIVNIVAK